MIISAFLVDYKFHFIDIQIYCHGISFHYLVASRLSALVAVHLVCFVTRHIIWLKLSYDACSVKSMFSQSYLLSLYPGFDYTVPIYLCYPYIYNLNLRVVTK